MAPRQKNTTVEPLSQDDFQSLLLEQARMAILGKAVDQGPGLFYPVVGQTVTLATAMNLERIWPVTEEYGRRKRTGLDRTVRYNLVVQHPSDWYNNSGVIRNAHARGDGGDRDASP